MRQAAEWIIARQEDDGGWGGIQPPWVYSILALHLLGYPLDHPVLSQAISGLDTFLVHEATPEGPMRWLEACQSPVWDTCLAATALLDAGADRRRRLAAPRRRVDRRRGDPPLGRLGRQAPEPRAGRLGVRVRQRRLPRHRRHRRGRARPRPRQGRPARAEARRRARHRLDQGHAVPRRRVGRLRRRQHPAPGREAAVLRLRRRHRPAVGRRHRARRRDARALRPGAATPRPCAAASSGCSTARRPTGRGSGGGAPTTSTAPARSSRRSSPPARAPTTR